MVDAIVSFVVERIGDYLIREVIFLSEVRNELESLKNELGWMRCFIKDADQKQSESPLIQKWVSDMRDIADDTECVLDELLVASIKKHSCGCIPHKGKEQMKLYSIGKEIEALRKRISDLSLKREKYGLQDINNKREVESKALQNLKQLRRSTSFGVEENVVGFEDDAKKLLDQLLNNERRRFVISIFGMGGLGKTTLAGKLYRNKDVKNHFTCSAWVSVSQDYEIADLLLRLIKSFKIEISNSDLEKMKEEDMERLLNNFLQERSYLVVIDDVWQKETWESLKIAFPDNNKGSRVVITTRSKDVAERSDERSHVHQLRFLTPDESWQLFCEKAFRNVKVDHGLEKLGREMVGKCGGLPLAIVVLGGLLSTKKPQEWRGVRDHVWRHLRNGSLHISNVLGLSFNDLPYHLKLCFIYLGLFPEDFEIDVEKLIRLLVAEGLILPDEDRIIEDVALDHLVQLIDRSLIQVGKRWWGKIATLRVHDLVRDLAIEKGKELNFIHIYNQTKNSTSSSNVPQCRRLALYCSMDNLSQENLSSLSRSVSLFNSLDPPSRTKQQLTSLCKRFPLLRVLNIKQGRQICSLPKQVERLIHLKYLGLGNLYITKVEPSILNSLQRLQTLDLFDSFMPIELPSSICNMKELRHLIGYFVGQLQIDNLTNLQTLKHVSVESWVRVNTDKLVNLRRLHIRVLEVSVREETFTVHSISKLKNLQLLSVGLGKNDSFASLQPLSNCRCLVDLRLRGRINDLPKQMYEVLPNLERLSLEQSHLKDDPMPVLEKLSNLMILALWDSYSGQKMVCRDNGFPRLEILSLEYSSNLRELKVEEGAMPMLRGFTMKEISGVKIPERLRSIPPPASEELDNNYWTNIPVRELAHALVNNAKAWQRQFLRRLRVECFFWCFFILLFNFNKVLTLCYLLQ